MHNATAYKLDASEPVVKTSREYGWLVIQRDEYDRMRQHDYAGPEPGGTVWVLSMDKDGATTLWKGVQLEELS